MTIIGAIMIASFMLTGCSGSSIESDAKRVAGLQCKAQKLMQKATSGDVSLLQESSKLMAESAELQKELEGKYTSESDQQKFAEAILKELGNCK